MPTFNKPTDNIPRVKTAINSIPPSNIRLQGYLMKQKHGRCRAWQKRFFVLYDEEIRYYKSKSDVKCLAVIPLDHYTLVPDAQPLTSTNQKQQKYNTFCLVSDDKSKYYWPDYFLQTPSPEEREEWVECLQSHVSQSTSVLEKWLDRLQLPHGDQPALSLYSSSESDIGHLSSPTLIPIAPHLLSPGSPSSITSSTSNILLPTSHQQILRNHKSVESFNTFMSHSSAGTNKRRPSDFTFSRSTDLSNRILSSKIFNWIRPKSSASSIASSTAESLHTDVVDSNSSGLLATPKMMEQQPLESPIIHPSEYNHDDDPSDRIKHPNDTSTTNFYYAQPNVYKQKHA